MRIFVAFVLLTVLFLGIASAEEAPAAPGGMPGGSGDGMKVSSSHRSFLVSGFWFILARCRSDVSNHHFSREALPPWEKPEAVLAAQQAEAAARPLMKNANNLRMDLFVSK